MLGVVAGRSLATKPGCGAQIDWGHPLANGLIGCWVLNENAGFLFDLVSRTPSINSPAILREGKWASYVRGVTVRGQFDTSTALRLVLGAVLPTAGPFSAALRYRKTDATNNAVGAWGVDTTSTLSRRCGAHIPFSDGKVYWDYGGAVEGTSRLSYTPASVADNAWVFTTGPSGMSICRNGIQEASNSANPTRTVSAAGEYVWLGAHAAVGSDSAEWEYFYIFSRQLTIAEAMWLNDEPYAFLTRPTYSRWYTGVSYPTAYLLENGVEYYLLENGSGVFLMEQGDSVLPPTIHVPYDKRPPYLGPILAQ